MSIKEKVQKRYQRIRTISIWMMGAGVLVALLTVLFIFVKTIDPIPAWNKYHFWAAGLMASMITAGVIMYLHANTSLKDIEKAIGRFNPDERDRLIWEKASNKMLIIILQFLYPACFIIASILFLLELINYIAWLLIIANYLTILITWSIIRKKEYDKYQ